MRHRRPAMAFAVLIAIGLRSPATASAQPQHLQHVRPLNERASHLVRRGLARSKTFRSTVQELERSPIVAYVKLDPYLERGLRATTQLMSAASSQRMVLIVLNPRAIDDALIALLGHELQHANEIAHAEPASVEDLETYFRSNGITRAGHRYETAQARTIEDSIRLELTGRATK